MLHLMESAVSVTEALCGLRSYPGEITELSQDDILYWGCWLYWREVFLGSSIDPKTLALAFLTVTDLAMSGDAGFFLDDPPTISKDRAWCELSMHQRFAYLCEFCQRTLQAAIADQLFLRYLSVDQNVAFFICRIVAQTFARCCLRTKSPAGTCYD